MPHTETDGLGERCRHDHSLEAPAQYEEIGDGPTNNMNHTD